MYLLCRFYFASIFSCFVMAALYVTDITRSVLTGSTLPFFGILLWLVIVRLCGPVLRECIAILSRQFPPLPASNGDWLPAHDRPISKGSFISRSFLAELGLSRGFIIRLVVPSTLSVSVYFDLAEILIRHSQRFEHGTRYICYCFYILVFKYSSRMHPIFRLVVKAMRRRYVGHVLLV